MLITTLQDEAVNECLRHNIPFVIYALPGETGMRFMASLPDTDGESHAHMDTGDDSFFISRFASDEPYMAGITSSMDEGAVIDRIAAHPDMHFAGCDERPYLTSTRRVSYDEAFHVMTRRLKKNGGKVVLSRHKSLFTTASITGTADRYFTMSPKAFRYLSFTPETGIWLGATPELLLETSPGSDEIHTMALAGTRPANGQPTPWDNKNLMEHQVVVKFITDVLASHGLEITTAPVTELQSGTVTHLCTGITGHGNIKSAGAIINDLNPTPAVAGWPRAVAIAEIDALETHQRRCYSGIVGVKTSEGLRVFVNLRCAFIAPATLNGCDGWVYNIYAGGGLMPDSQLDDEWAETSRKMDALNLCLDDITENPIEARF